MLETFCGKLKEHLSDEFYKLVGRNVLRLRLSHWHWLWHWHCLSLCQRDEVGFAQFATCGASKKMSWKTVWKLKVIKGNIPKIKTIKL